MWFVTIALFSIFFYIRGYKVSALLIFFFFLTKGFNLIPDDLVDLGVPLTKNSDYAFFIMLTFLSVDFFFNRDSWKIDTFLIIVIIFFCFLFVCVIYNHYTLGIGWNEIIRTVRYLFFLLAYIVFRSMNKEHLQFLLNCLFFATVFCSVLYLLQIILDRNILVETMVSSARLFGFKIPRYYNQPDMLPFFVFVSIYANPLKGVGKWLTMIILIMALMGSFHRSLTGFFLASIAIGYILKLPKIRRVQILSGMTALILFIVLFAGQRFAGSRAYRDIQTIITSKNITDIDIDISDLKDATFTFRMAHLIERNQYIQESRMSMLFGGALLTEDSKALDKFFDFKVGLLEELTGEIMQVDTPDISYSILFIRFGYLGTFLFLLIYFYFTYYFYKNRKNKFGFLSFLYMIMNFGISFFSWNLVLPITFLLPMISYLIIRKTNEQQLEESYD